MKIFYQNIILAFSWALLTGDMNANNFIEGFLIGFLILFITRNALQPTGYFKKLPKIIGFIFYFLYELLVANLKIAWDIATPRDLMRPGIIALPLDAKTDMEITFLANLITLTPGTLSLDCSEDKKVLYVHTMYLGDPENFKRQLKNGLERKLLEVMR